MTPRRVGILGANGQVGAEVCLVLSNHRDKVEIVPICRNRGGSAFLRYNGVACRHGHPADEHQAPDLLGDCDVIVNLALASGTPAEVRAVERSLIENSVRFSRPGAKIIYFSTQTVYGDPRPRARIRWRSAYGREKLRSEQTVRRACRAHDRKPCYVLRLGHVCGEIQNITSAIRGRISSGVVCLSEVEHVSNTVHTATIADAILKIVAERESPGVYDLMNHPQWTWTQVYEREAARINVPLRIERVAEPSHRFNVKSALIAPARRMAGAIKGVPLTKEMVMRAMTHLPKSVNQRAQGSWYRSRAATEIAQLTRRRIVDESHIWVPQGKYFLRSLAATEELLNDPAYQLPPFDGVRSWPADLPPCGSLSR